MANKMLIDASHPEETRVVVVRGSRIEEFDFESEHKKQIKGNIYLAKVTRVEPSLQAAFVEYGGNRHGFLAFSEIHPDYYQIPVADRQALMEDELARAQEEDENEERKIAGSRAAKPRRPGGGTSIRAAEASDLDIISETPRPDSEDQDAEDGERAEAAGHDDVADHPDDRALSDNEHEAPELMGEEPNGEEGEEKAEDDRPSEAEGEEGAGVTPSGQRRGRRPRSRRRGSEDEGTSEEEEEVVDEIGAEDAAEEIPVRQPRAPRKQYKIQDVIKRRQILLVQVVKEERGNKGAALTTFLSLAGRYSVLMPNTARGGGISRKITNITDRKRLKEVARDLDVPRGMGIILRTAGAMRTKAEVKRDYEYLMRLWETVRNLTLASTAPALVYEEGSLIKRSIRDLYNKDIDQILVSGEDGYREAKDFMRMLMPSQAKVVQPYRDPVPVFARGGIEAQLDRMLQPHVTLKSGGYIIINQTEALVAIDVNSGRSTREHSIEDTAYQTNLEAAEEVARQLRLRDLAGLIVIDFIDMEEKRNNRAVEKKVKDCLKDDRARIQVGRISHFGLMEMSRQRIRASVLESTTRVCPTCDGVGHIRSNSSLALHVLRAIEEHLQKQATHDLVVKVPTATALYVLNEKRNTIEELEAHHGLRIVIEADDSHGHQHVAIDHGAEAVRREPRPAAVSPLTAIPEEFDEIDQPEEADDETVEAAVSGSAEEPRDDLQRRKRRRRRRRGGSEDGSESEHDQEAGGGADAGDAEFGDAASGGMDAPSADGSEAAETEDDDAAQDAGSDDGRGRKRRRRGRRGGRRNREGELIGEPEPGASLDAENGSWPAETTDDGPVAAEDGEPVPVLADAIDQEAEDTTGTGFDAEPAVEASSSIEEIEAFVPVTADPSAIARAVSADVAALEEDAAAEDRAKASVAAAPQLTSSGASEDDEAEAKPKRTGWWARRSFF